jgi:hypothetical protein
LFEELCASVPEDELRTSMHVVRTDGTVASAGDALIELMALSPKTARQARLAKLWPPLRRKIAADYRRLADRRGELSERVPDVPPTVVRPQWIRRPDVDT